MKRFMENFEPIKYKYEKYIDVSVFTDEEKEQIRMELDKDTYKEERWTLEDIEEAYQTLKKVYGEHEDDFCQVIKIASEKFMGEYVGIKGIRQLFKSSYFYFEWMMHLEFSKNKHDYTYYRDHYVHQVRNMYEMFMLLRDASFEEICRDLYLKLDNKTAEMIRHSIDEEKNRYCHAYEIIQKKAPGKLEILLYGYLFYSATIIASLLHDIGYPIAYIGRTVKELGSFLPFSHIFLRESETISTIHATLQDSLLYGVVGQDEVANRVAARDHGALSAVVLLYKYYDSGELAALTPIKRAAIELGALMIYNHTLKYRNQGNKKSPYYKNVFEENPLSFLFRLCDDLQEWNRIYFDITERSNFFICGKCFMPLIKDDELIRANNNAAVKGQKYYSCWCGKGNGRNVTTFAYRRLINIDVCEYIKWKGNEAEASVKIQYDKGKLLQLVSFHSSFAMKRANGVWEIKQMLENQRKFPNMFVDFFISNNSIMIKSEILGELFCKKGYRFSALKDQYVSEMREKEGIDEKLIYLQSKIEEKGPADSELKSAWKDDIKSLKAAIKDNATGKSEIEKKNSRKWIFNKKSVYYMWEKSFFYYCLALIGYSIQEIDKECWEYDRMKQLQSLIDAFNKNFKITDYTEKRLTANSLWHKAGQFNEEQYRAITKKKERDLYQDSFLLSEFDVDLAHTYIGESAYDEIKKAAWAGKTIDAMPIRYDYYSDYYLYYFIAEKLLHT